MSSLLNWSNPIWLIEVVFLMFIIGKRDLTAGCFSKRARRQSAFHRKISLLPSFSIFAIAVFFNLLMSRF